MFVNTFNRVATLPQIRITLHLISAHSLVYKGNIILVYSYYQFAIARVELSFRIEYRCMDQSYALLIRSILYPILLLMDFTTNIIKPHIRRYRALY